MNSILSLFKLAGAFAAVVLGIGLLSKSDTGIFASQEVSGVAEMSLAAAEEAGTNVALGAYDSRSRPERVRPTAPSRSARPSSASRSTPSRPSAREVQPTSRPSNNRASMSAHQIEDWIQLNVAQTYLEAEKETISPGAILATGVYFLEQGSGDMSMTAADVAAYLAEVRQSADANAKARMKYIANSEQWFEGLNLAGFDGDRIAKIFREHELNAFDKQMFNRHVERKVEQTDYAREDVSLAAEKDSRDADLADAYNDYASRDDVRAKHSLPTRVKAVTPSSREVSEGRREAEGIRIGESKTYDDPRLFWAVLQEMIALENDYASWAAYKAENPRDADRSFQSRSDIMALGGEMKVTRKRQSS